MLAILHDWAALLFVLVVQALKIRVADQTIAGIYSFINNLKTNSELYTGLY